MLVAITFDIMGPLFLPADGVGGGGIVMVNVRPSVRPSRVSDYDLEK